MSKADFGRIVAALRKETRNEFDQSMTQNDLADLARIPLITLQKIEQGRQTNLKPELVQNLVDALNLTSIFRQQFFLASLGLGEKELTKNRMTAQEILDQLHSQLILLQVPAYICNSFGDLMYANPLLFHILDVSPQKLDSGHMLCKWNINRLFYSPEFEPMHQMMGASYLPYARRRVFLFKALTIKYRCHWYFQKLLPELNHFPKFRQFWQSTAYHNEDVFILTNPLTLTHPSYGALSFISHPIQALTDEIDLQICCFQAADIHTARVCADCAQKVGTTPLRFNRWLVPPKPSLLV